MNEMLFFVEKIDKELDSLKESCDELLKLDFICVKKKCFEKFKKKN